MTTNPISRAAAFVGAIALIPACTTSIGGRPHAAEQVQTLESPVASAAAWIATVMPDADELSQVCDSYADDIDPLVGDATDLRDTMIGSQVAESQCISAISPLERRTFGAAPVREIAYATLPDATFGALALPSAGAARSMFETLANQWRECDGQTVIKSSGADSHANVIGDVDFTADVVSAVIVMSTQSTGMRSQTGRALGVAGNCIIDVELRTSTSSSSAVALTQLMMSKVTAQQ